MRVLIHALGATMGGAMRHLTNFLPELGKQDKQREYVVLVRNSFPELQLAENIRLERIQDHQISTWLKRMIYDVVELPKKLKKEKFDAIVSLLNFGPIWSPVPHVFFQRNSLYYCHHYLSKIKGRQKFETSFRRRLAIESMKRADLIVTPSNAMADMIKESCPTLKGHSFHTLYHGFSKDTLQEPLDEKYAKQLSVEGLKLLYPTHLASHKGFDVLFDILACLKRDNINFTLFTTIAEEDWPEGMLQYRKLVDELKLDNQVVFMGRIPQPQMGALYKQCDLMVYPSLCESFGFSMIEAMGYGLPIIAADTAINKEICGNGAIYYSSTNSKEGAEAIKLLLSNKIQLIANQKQRFVSFDWGWKRYSCEFINLFEHIK